MNYSNLNRKTILSITLLITSLLISVFITLKSDSIKLFPFGKNIEDYNCDTYHELTKNHSNPKLKLSKRVRSEVIEFSYKLSEDTVIPRAFAAFYISKKDTLLNLLDFSRFNSISIDLESKKGKKIPILIYMHFERNVHDGNFVLNIPMTYMIDYKGPKKYNIPFSEFTVPEWWLKSKDIKNEELESINFSMITSVIIESCHVLERGESDTIILREITVHNKDKKYYLMTGIPLALILFILSLLIFIKRNKKVDNTFDDEQLIKANILKIENYIATNYFEQDLSIHSLTKAIDLNPRQIKSLFKKHLNTSFKKYLKAVRVKIAKQLLTDTEQGIGLVAHNTGFKSPLLFTKSFKSLEGVSPLDYREKLRAQ